MTALLLRRRHPAQHVSRFYALAVQPDLFGAWCVVREWGRIGSPGRMVVQPFATEAEADAAAAQLRRQKERRGYRCVTYDSMAACVQY